jgi:hypothetical protein
MGSGVSAVQPVRVPGSNPGEHVPVKAEGQFQTGIPAGVLEGTPIDATLAINISPFPLPPGGRFVWRLSIDGETNEDWQVAFSTRPAGQAMPGQPPQP